MLLSAVSVLVVAQSSSEIPEGLMNNPVFYPQQNEVISSWGEWISNAKETLCNMESVTCLFIKSVTVMDIHFPIAFRKSRTPSTTSPRTYILSPLRIISIKWTIMEMLWPPLHQFARFTSATSKHMQVNLGFRDFYWKFSDEFIVHHKGIKRWYEEELSLLAEVDHFAGRSSYPPNKHWKIWTQRAWACLPNHYSVTHQGDIRLLTKPLTVLSTAICWNCS